MRGESENSEARLAVAHPQCLEEATDRDRVTFRETIGDG
jgi:hypothetical protein